MVCMLPSLTYVTDINPMDELAPAVGEFVQTVNDLATSDLGKYLSHSLDALAELESAKRRRSKGELRTPLVSSSCRPVAEIELLSA